MGILKLFIVSPLVQEKHHRLYRHTADLQSDAYIHNILRLYSRTQRIL